jgi:EmrB/QacA subfamily drug resistance transporter
MGPFLISSVNVALPTIENALSLSSLSMTWIVNAYLLASAVFLLPAGKIADSWGQVRTYRTGILIFSITTLLCALSTNGMLLVVSRIFQGIGAAMTITTGAAILVGFFPPNLRGRVLGINVAAVYLGLATGPFIGGFLTQSIGWQSIFFVSAFLGAVSTFLAFKWLTNQVKTASKEQFDILGFVLYALFLITFTYGATFYQKSHSWAIMVISIVVLPIFLYTQAHRQNPLLDIRFFMRNKLFAYSNLATLINYSATFAVVFLLSLYLQKIKHFTPATTGTILVIQPLIQVLISPFAGTLSDKHGARWLASGGMMLNAVGLFAFSALNQSTALPFIIVLLIIMGVGFGLFSSPNINTIMGSVAPNQLGFASGISSTMRVIGQVLSMTITTLLFSVFFENLPLSEVTSESFIMAYKWAFYILGTICTLGIFFSIQRGNDKSDS